MKANYMEISKLIKTDEIAIKFNVTNSYENTQKINKIMKIIENEKELQVDIKQYRKKRSLNANAYCFTLCSKIAEKIGNTKEYVYKAAIRTVGQYEILPIKDEAVKRWIEAWESKGLGWQSEILRDSKLEGYTNTINYFGSSIYDSKDMSLLLEEIVFQAKELEIDTITENEKLELISKWGSKEE